MAAMILKRDAKAFDRAEQFAQPLPSFGAQFETTLRCCTNCVQSES